MQDGAGGRTRPPSDHSEPAAKHAEAHHAQPAWRQRLRDSHYLLTAYLAFAGGFFVMPSSKSHNLFFYTFVMLPYWLALRRDEAWRLLRSPTFALCAAYLVWLFASILWSAEPDLDPFLRYGKHLLYLLSFVGLTIALMLRYPSFLTLLHRTLAVGAALTGLVSMVVFYGQDQPVDERLIGFGRLDETNLAAAVYGTVALMGIWLGLRDQRDGPLWRAVTVLSIAVCLLFVGLSQSRGPQLALLAALVAGLALAGRWRLGLLLVGAVATYAALGLLELAPLGRYATAGASFRPEIWASTWPHISDHLLFGNGQNFRPAYTGADGMVFDHPHSVFVASVLYVGIVGTVPLLLAIGRGLAQPLRYGTSPPRLMVAVSILFAVGCMATDDHKLLVHPREIWLYFWMPVAIAAGFELQQSPHPSAPPV